MNPSPSSSIAIHTLSRCHFIQSGSVLISNSMITACANSNQPQFLDSDLDKVTVSTNWVTQAEHGGFYQAIATGIYKDHGLDLWMKMASSQVASGTQS
jgi:NitT/TauT family transport system substrate-binding protein